VNIVEKMKELFAQGGIYDAIRMGKNHITKFGLHGNEEVIYRIALGYYAIDRLYKAYYWISKVPDYNPQLKANIELEISKR